PPRPARSTDDSARPWRAHAAPRPPTASSARTAWRPPATSGRRRSVIGEHAQQLGNRIVELVDDPFFQRNRGVVSDPDLFGADFRAALGDVAVTDAVRGLQIASPVLAVDGVHLERGGVDEMPRPDEAIEHLVLAQHVAHVLAEE